MPVPPSNDQGDAELLILARAGEESAIAALFGAHKVEATRFARRLAGPVAADDLVADAFARLVALFAHGSGPDSNFRAYLFSAIRNRHLDLQRTARREEPVSHLPWMLDQEALAAVIRHERSHLRSRHDLVIEGFTVVHRAFPFSSPRALAEVTLLVEVLADRAAIRETGRKPLVVALSHLVGTTSPDATLAAANGGVVARLDVLRDPRPRPLQAGLLFVVAGALLVLPTLLVAVPWLRSLV